jgi:hypothetical protein
MPHMSDKFVTVQTFNNSFQAQLAKNLLENEGIESMVSGELAQDVMLGTGLHQIALQVHEDQAQRAAGILAAVEADAELDDDWEEQAQSGVWVCTICGEPISNRLSVCYSCQTPREGIRATAPRGSTAIQPDPSTLPTGEEVQKRDVIARAPAPAPVPIPSPVVPRQEEEEPELATVRGDNLARRAFLASMLGVMTLLLLPVAWYYLVRTVVSDAPLSPRGIRHLYAALAINGLFVLIVLVLCAGRVI